MSRVKKFYHIIKTTSFRLECAFFHTIYHAAFKHHANHPRQVCHLSHKLNINFTVTCHFSIISRRTRKPKSYIATQFDTFHPPLSRLECQFTEVKEVIVVQCACKVNNCVSNFLVRWETFIYSFFFPICQKSISHNPIFKHYKSIIIMKKWKKIRLRNQIIYAP